MKLDSIKENFDSYIQKLEDIMKGKIEDAIEDENVGENIIVEEFMKGYKFKDKVIRYSMVKVAN